MFFKDVIGHQLIKERLLHMVAEEQVSHALLFSGPHGSGLLPMALAFAQYLNCENQLPDDSCGVCPACHKMNKLIHPDFHFVFPVIKRKSIDPISSNYMNEWREFVTRQPYFSESEWYAFLGAERTQGKIYTKEGDEINRKLSLKTYEGRRKIMIIWQPEKMHPFAANKLLKILEEPPLGTVFILVSDYPSGVLPTILSRTQQLRLPRIKNEEMESALLGKFGMSPEQTPAISRMAGGDFIKAREIVEQAGEPSTLFNAFRQLMRSTYSKNLVGMMQWVDAQAGLPKEQLKKVLAYGIDMLRESLIANFNVADLLYAGPGEEDFIDKFKRFVNENNVPVMVDEMSLALAHIEQNGNNRLVLFDMSLKLSDLFV